nr:MAG TPA: tail tape measure [Caudoviricetes sp.]
MADSALGSALIIPESALKKIKEADDKLQKLQDTAKNTASSVTQSFKDMSVGTKPFLDSLDQVIAKLATINASASNASSGISNVGASAGNMNNNITSAAQNIQNMVAQLSKMNGSGTSGIMQAALAFQRLQESAKGASGMNIAELKQEIGSIESMLRDTTQNLTKADQDALIKRKKSLQDELRYQQQMYNERAVAFQKALDKMVSAEQSYNNKQRKAYADRAKDYQTRNNKANTTYQGALDFSATANTLNRQVRAIEYLKEARMKLSQTDADYKRKLDILNAAIEQHNKNLKEAGVNSRALTEQTSYMAGYMSRWAQRMAFAFSVGSVKNFVEQIASVRGQFELSERSLEAILQNKPKADEIFNKTVELAVKSPFRIKDLVDYTRQLSAYRIESDKLYDTTKRLADVSAGLGVDMGRLILAYGQVKAAAYLRGSEVRQFTEAGINMYGELQQYFKEVKGEAYTTAQIVDMISKRKVTFEDVEAIFQRMTDKGGTFYNMQEIQAETLQGKISNLKDAFDVMLNDIGKANEGTFKGMISGATEMLDNWQNIAKIIKYVGELLLIIKVRSMLAGTETTKAFARLASINNVAGIGKIALGIKSAISQIGTAAVAAGKAIQGALPIMALMTALEIFTSLSDSVKEYNENLSKAMDSYAKSMDILKKSQDSYTLAIKIDGKNGKDKREDEIKHLISEMEKQGYSVTIPVNFGSAEDADKVYQKLTSDYKKFIDDMMEMDAIRAQNIKDSVGPGENIDEDLSDYENSYNKIIAYTSKWESALESVRQNYKYLTEDAQLAVDRVGREEDYKDKTEYLEAVYNALQKAKVGFITFVQMSDVQRQKIDGTMDAVRSSIEGANASMFSSLRRDKEEVIKETKGLFDVLAKYTSDPKEIMLRINRFAADHDYSETKKMLLTHLAEDKFNIRISADTNSVQKTIDYIDKTVQSFVDSKTYKISIDVSDLKDPLSQWKNYFENLEKNQKALKESDAWLRRIMSKGKDKKGLFSSDESMFTDDELKLIGVKRKPKMYGAWAKEQANEIKLSASQLEKIAKERLKAVGDVFTNWDWETKEDKKNARKNKNAADKAKRDILNERISLLKEMNKQYEQLDKYMDDDSAAQSVMKQYADNLKYVGMPDEIVKSFVPDKQGLIQALKQIEPTIKDFKKRAQLKNDIVELQIQLDTEFFQQQLNDVKNEINKSFDQLNLYKKLQGEGLSDGLIKSMFGELTSSFDDVRKGIEDQFTAKFGNNTKWSSDIWKQYQEQMDKLDKEIYQDQVNQAQELIKAYKQQLSDQLQLDKWYIEEKQKIQNNANIAKNPELQKQLQENLTAQYKKKTGENTWKNFQGSDMYVKIFENLDHTSTKVLDYMIQRLQSLRDEMKNLDPTQVKAITEQISKLQETRNSRNPFKAFTSGLKELVKYTKEYKKLGGDNALISTSDKYDKEEKNIENQGKIIANLDAEYNKSMLLNGLDDEKTKTLKTNLDLSKNQLDNMKKQHSETKGTLDTLNNVQGETDNAKNKFSKSVTDITSIVSSMATAFNGLFEALGGSDEQLENTLSVVDNIGQAIGSYYSGNYAGVVSGAMGALTGVAKLFSNEGKIDKKIARQERAVNSLQHAYEKLKKSMDDAFDTQKLYEYNQKSVDSLKKQQKAYQAMINAERGRKKPDEGKIQEWEQQIDDLNTTIQELGESMTEALGGFGSQSNYKSAAEAFSEAWVDAFNEGSDALEALNNKFDEYFNTMLTKQLMNRATSKYIQPILEAFDKAVSEGSEGGNNGLDVTKKELEGIKELKDKNLALFNEYAKNLMDVLNVKPTGSSNISALQQGIQSVTESTAQALESILSSLRYYVATQQADVRIIRDTLLEKLGNSISAITQDTSSSPVLIELRLQTTILTDIRDTLASCVKGGHKQGRNGIKVFMN